MSWQERARRHIAALDAGFPPDTDLKTRRDVLRANAHCFHSDTSHGKKIWGQEARKYLERHGQPLRTPESAPTFGPDIIFPFRGLP